MLGLPAGKHTVKLVVKDAKNAASSNSNIYVTGTIVYKTADKINEGYKFSFQQ